MVTTATAALVVAMSVWVAPATADTAPRDRSDSASVRRTKLSYEHKIRTLSPVARRFRYFATIQIGDSVYMTAKDFIDSLVGGNLQPAHLVIDQYACIEGEYKESAHMLPITAGEESLFAELREVIGPDALISFSDYIFLLSMMHHDARKFELAFKMFDQDGNGNIDRTEFAQVQSVTQHAAKASRALQNAQRSLFEDRFFGDSQQHCLSFAAFLPFFTGLRRMVSKFEFERNSKNKLMTVPEFVKLVFGMRGVNPAELRQITERAAALSETMLCYNEYEVFVHLLDELDDVSTAISLYSAAGRDLTQGDLHRAATVAGVKVSPKLVNILFVLFDTDGDGTLSEKEFVRAMSQSASSTSNKRRAASVSLTRTLGGLLECMKLLSGTGGAEAERGNSGE